MGPLSRRIARLGIGIMVNRYTGIIHFALYENTRCEADYVIQEVGDGYQAWLTKILSGSAVGVVHDLIRIAPGILRTTHHNGHPPPGEHDTRRS
jgi:hypothetical protein